MKFLSDLLRKIKNDKTRYYNFTIYRTHSARS